MQGMGMWAELTLMSVDQCRHLLKGSQVDNQSIYYKYNLCHVVSEPARGSRKKRRLYRDLLSSISKDISIINVVLTLERLGRVREVPPRDRAVRRAGDEADHGGAPHHEAAELHRRPH